MKDYIGQTLKVGDRVVHARSGRGGGFTGTFYVHSFTAVMVRIAAGFRSADVYSTVTPSNLVKVPYREDCA
jgi:hypothetical protein